MNKSLIYSYICQLECELFSVIPNNSFKEIIVSEIITGAIVQLHELDNTSKSDEDTAKGLVSMNIQTFYSAKHLPKVEDKYWNWDNRVQYGYKGRIMPTPDNLIRFREAVDYTKPIVAEERMAMTHAVRNCTLAQCNSNKLHFKTSFVLVLIGIIIAVLASIGIYSYSINNRYQRINASTVFDNWTGKPIDVFENMENED
ncbi:MAG: hypothetical protein OSJ56_13230 [Prevotella sp.]|nr:hypothetical protein [Prevotella sp.]